MTAFVLSHVVPAAYALLPAAMASAAATRELLAIGWQESRFEHRRQINGPARGFWQFETGGVNQVLTHSASKDLAVQVLRALRYPERPSPYGCLMALEHNDVLAFAFARLLLWTEPRPLPVTLEDGWRQYVENWRPGKPHEATWAAAWRHADQALA